MTTVRLQKTSRGVRITIRLQPKASSNGIVGVHGDALKIRVTAPPVDGAANDALIELLARALGISRAAITIASGASSRTKVVDLEGVTEEHVMRLLPS